MISQFVIIKAKYERGTIDQSVKYSIEVKLPQPPTMNLGVMYKFSHMLSLEMFSSPTLQTVLSPAWFIVHWLCEFSSFFQNEMLALISALGKQSPGNFWVRFQPGLHREFQAKLGYRRSLSKKNKDGLVVVEEEETWKDAHIIACIPTYCLNK